MGNQPSSPSSVPQPTPAPTQSIPPLPPPCDLDCQKQKQLVLLKQTLDSTDEVQDPSGYEKARIAYFTLLNGPGWLAQEKQRIASSEVEPVLKTYQQQYDSLKGNQQSQSIFKSLSDSLKAQESADEQGNQFLKKQLSMEQDKADVSNRLNELGSSQTNQYISWAIDILIVILGLLVLYNLYIKFFGQLTVSPSISDLTST